MKDFDKNWQVAARLAGQVPVPGQTAPEGFARRVVARSNLESQPISWERLMLKWVAGMAVILALCSLLELPHLKPGHPMRIDVEETVAQLIWSL
jgi:hypothetical protein